MRPMTAADLQEVLNIFLGLFKNSRNFIFKFTVNFHHLIEITIQFFNIKTNSLKLTVYSFSILSALLRMTSWAEIYVEIYCSPWETTGTYNVLSLSISVIICFNDIAYLISCSILNSSGKVLINITIGDTILWTILKKNDQLTRIAPLNYMLL